MTFQSALIVVKDMAVSRAFYERLFGLEVAMDFGENITFRNAFSLQEQKCWEGLISGAPGGIQYRGNDAELYFETEDFAGFLEQMEKESDLQLLHGVKEFPWGQRAIRFYDPDGHVLEVGESMVSVIRRFLSEGMTAEETAEKTQYPLEFVKKCI